MVVRLAGTYLCDCGSFMLFLDGTDVPRRRMHCIAPGCGNQFRVVLEPLFEAKPQASAMAESNLEAGIIPATGR